MSTQRFKPYPAYNDSGVEWLGKIPVGWEVKQLGHVKAGYTCLSDADIVIAKITPCFENGKGALAAGLTNGIAFGTTEPHVLRTTEAGDRRFMFGVTVTDAFRRLGEADMYGAGGQKRGSGSFVRNLRPAPPPVAQQRAIARLRELRTTLR